VDPADKWALRRAGKAQPARGRGCGPPTHLDARSPSAPGHSDEGAGPERLNRNRWTLCAVGGCECIIKEAAGGAAGPARRSGGRRTSGQRSCASNRLPGTTCHLPQTAIERQASGAAAAAAYLCRRGASFFPTRRWPPAVDAACGGRARRKDAAKNGGEPQWQAVNGPRCDQ